MTCCNSNCSYSTGFQSVITESGQWTSLPPTGAILSTWGHWQGLETSLVTTLAGPGRGVPGMCRPGTLLRGVQDAPEKCLQGHPCVKGDARL